MISNCDGTGRLSLKYSLLFCFLLPWGYKVVDGGNAGSRETQSECSLKFQHLWCRKPGGDFGTVITDF